MYMPVTQQMREASSEKQSTTLSYVYQIDTLKLSNGLKKRGTAKFFNGLLFSSASCIAFQTINNYRRKATVNQDLFPKPPPR